MTRPRRNIVDWSLQCASGSGVSSGLLRDGGDEGASLMPGGMWLGSRWGWGEYGVFTPCPDLSFCIRTICKNFTAEIVPCRKCVRRDGRWEKDSHCPQCMHENSRARNEGKWRHSRKWFSENAQIDPAAKAGAIWKPAKCCPNFAGSDTILMRQQHPEPTQAHKTRMNCQSVQRVTASQAGDSPQNAIKNSAI